MPFIFAFTVAFAVAMVAVTTTITTFFNNKKNNKELARVKAACNEAIERNRVLTNESLSMERSLKQTRQELANAQQECRNLKGQSNDIAEALKESRAHEEKAASEVEKQRQLNISSTRSFLKTIQNCHEELLVQTNKSTVLTKKLEHTERVLAAADVRMGSAESFAAKKSQASVFPNDVSMEDCVKALINYLENGPPSSAAGIKRDDADAPKHEYRFRWTIQDILNREGLNQFNHEGWRDMSAPSGKTNRWEYCFVSPTGKRIRSIKKFKEIVIRTLKLKQMLQNCGY